MWKRELQLQLISSFRMFSESTCIDESKTLSSARVNPFPNKPWFLRISLLKTLLEKEKLLVASTFGELSAIFIKLEIVVCKLFQFGSLKFVVWETVKTHDHLIKALTLYLVQIQSIYRRQNKSNWKLKFEIWLIEGRKCWLPAFCPFPTMFSKRLFLWGC